MVSISIRRPLDSAESGIRSWLSLAFGTEAIAWFAPSDAAHHWSVETANRGTNLLSRMGS